MTDQNKPLNPDEIPVVTEFEDADGTEVEETEEEKLAIQPDAEEDQDNPEYATPNAEIASDDSDEEAPAARHATPNATSSLLNLESLINGYLVDLEKVQEKYKTQRDMFNDSFENDADFSQIMMKVKEVNRTKSVAKQRIQKLPNVVELASKMREYKEEIKDIHEGLSAYLQQYKELSGSNQLTRDNGEVVEIISVTKFIKRKG
ncbi:MAG: hypothetical protein ABIO02_02840, partial [Patescibacteria group bacterium]